MPIRTIIALTLFLFSNLANSTRSTSIEDKCFEIANNLRTIEVKQDLWNCQTHLKTATGITYDACIKICGKRFKLAISKLNQVNQALTSAINDRCQSPDEMWNNIFDIELLIDKILIERA